MPDNEKEVSLQRVFCIITIMADGNDRNGLSSMASTSHGTRNTRKLTKLACLSQTSAMPKPGGFMNRTNRPARCPTPRSLRHRMLPKRIATVPPTLHLKSPAPSLRQHRPRRNRRAGRSQRRSRLPLRKYHVNSEIAHSAPFGSNETPIEHRNYIIARPSLCFARLARFNSFYP